MPDSRRRLLITFLSATGVVALDPVLSALGQDTGRNIKPHPYPNGRDPSAPVNTGEPSRPDPKAMRQENQKEIKLRVAKLYDMVTELKEEVEKSDINATLSLPVMKKAHQIEKLAKQIKDLARG
jgi:hypothetical protein